MKRYISCITICFFQLVAQAQSPVDRTIEKGNEYYRQSAYELAERQYRKALEDSPHNATALYNLANSLYQQKKYDEAEGLFNQVTQSAQNSNIKAAAYYNTGVLYSKERDLPASIEAYKNALRLNPNDKQARENLQKAIAELRNQQQQSKSRQNQSSNMSQKQAEEKLKQLAEKEKSLQERLQNRNSRRGNSMEQDW